MAINAPPLRRTLQELVDSETRVIGDGARVKVSGKGIGLGVWRTSPVPTWTNLTIGNAVVVARHVQIGKTIVAYVSAVLGNTSSVDGTPVSVSLPVAEASTYNTGGTDPVGLAYFIDATSTDFNGRVALFDGKVVLQVYNVSATYSTNTNLNTTVPFTWTTSDAIRTQFTYEAA